MKILCCVLFVSALCLFSLPAISTAEALTPPSLCEASSAILPPNKTLAAAGMPEPQEASLAEGGGMSLLPTGAPATLDRGQQLAQVPVENVPPEPASSEEAEETIADPVEPVNRVFFHFNDKLYFWVLKPVATGYQTVVPEDGRLGIRNFFSNLTTPIRLVNCVLQARFKGAGIEAARFVVNTTYGLVGFVDTAKREFKIEKQEADFGQTLGIWGMGPVLYLNWPLLGPATLRETVGYVADALLDFRTYLPSEFRIVNASAWAVDKVNETSLTLGEYESLKKAALDPYIAVREAYVQYRQNKIRK